MEKIIRLVILSALLMFASCSSEEAFLYKIETNKFISLDGSTVIAIDKNELRWYPEKIQDCWNYTADIPPFRLVRQNDNFAIFQMVTDEKAEIKVSEGEEGLRIETMWGDPFYVVPTDDCVEGIDFI